MAMVMLVLALALTGAAALPEAPRPNMEAFCRHFDTLTPAELCAMNAPGFYCHPCHSSKYFHCSPNGGAVEKHCGAGKTWDSLSQRCHSGVDSMPECTPGHHLLVPAKSAAGGDAAAAADFAEEAASQAATEAELLVPGDSEAALLKAEAAELRKHAEEVLAHAEATRAAHAALHAQSTSRLIEEAQTRLAEGRALAQAANEDDVVNAALSVAMAIRQQLAHGARKNVIKMAKNKAPKATEAGLDQILPAAHPSPGNVAYLVSLIRRFLSDDDIIGLADGLIGPYTDAGNPVVTIDDANNGNGNRPRASLPPKLANFLKIKGRGKSELQLGAEVDDQLAGLYAQQVQDASQAVDSLATGSR